VSSENATALKRLVPCARVETCEFGVHTKNSRLGFRTLRPSTLKGLRRRPSSGETAFAAEVDAVGFDLKGLAQDAQGGVVGVQRPVDDGRDDALGIVLTERVFDDGLAGAGLAHDDAEAALLAVDAEHVDNAFERFNEKYLEAWAKNPSGG
jgi:hypothetical protein